jgi:hypothetical protein
MAEDEILVNNGTNSSASLTASTGEERANKLKSDDKLNQKLNSMRNGDHSLDESSEKSNSGAKGTPKVKRPSLKDREKQSVKWLTELKKLEDQNSMEPSEGHNEDDMPKYCSNKICPISENKIPKTPKVQNLMKRVVLRKVFFEENDERWYCIKCLKTHNDSLYCYYCGQIYFVSEENLEDDGKAWILCDDCDKWVSKSTFLR